jgi:Endoglucanase
MNGELSHGLPALITSGNRIMRSDSMTQVLLRGINRSGLEYSEPGSHGFLQAAGISREELQEIVCGWRANIIRVPFNQDWCLNGRGAYSAEDYLAALDQEIAWASEFGAYTILDLQWLDADTAYGTTEHPGQGRVANRVPPSPNGLTTDLWRLLAARYRDEPAVLFDLLNEPHDVLDDDWHALNLIGADAQVVASNETRFTAREWSRWSNYLTAAIRDIRPEGILLIGGVDWAFDLSSVKVNAPNIVYSTHIYSNRSRKRWPLALGRCREVPVFVGEWGGVDDDLQFGEDLAQELQGRGLGWTAWSWSDFPRLVASPHGPAYDPTAFGKLVRNQLTSISS